MMKTIRILTKAAVIGSLALGAATVANSADEESRGALEEVIVTATKRSESLQSVPVSISAISGEDLDKRGITEFFNYAISIPNLSFGAATDGVLSGRSISLRGISGNNTTGVYIDDTPVTETITPRILDLERVEVLRGPTGTLYGARALGGTIRYISKQPDFEGTHGKLRAGLSSTDESGGMNYIVNGAVNITLNETLAARVTVFQESESGVFDRAVGTIKNHLTDPATLVGPPDSIIKDVDDERTSAIQLSLLYEPNDELSITPKIVYQKTKLDGFPLADINAKNFTQNRDFNTAEGGTDNWTLYSLNINHAREFGAFVSATSYFTRNTAEVEGSGSFVNLLQALPGAMEGFGLFGTIPVTPVTSPIHQRYDFDTFVQEFRFASTFNGPFNFVSGVFYQKTDDTESFIPRNFARGLEDNWEAFRVAAIAAGVPEIPATVQELYPFGDLIFTAFRPSETKEFGIYSEFTYDLNDQWAFTFGSRWFDTDISFSSQQAGLAAGVPLADDVALSTIPATSGQQSQNGFVFKGSVEYQASNDVLIFAKIAEGFRIGGANGPVPTGSGTLGKQCDKNRRDLGLVNINTGSYGSDDLISYELGVKADINHIFRVNATGFIIDFDNIQQTIQLACGFQFINNFGAARSQGVEIELVAQPGNNLNVNLSVGYTDAKFTQTTFNGTINSKGDRLQFVPKVTAALSIDYVIPDIFLSYGLFIRSDINYVGQSLSLVNATKRTRDAYEQISLRIGVTNDRFTGTVFFRNLTNNIANLGDNRSLAAETSGRPRFVVSRPRTIGVEFNYNF